MTERPKPELPFDLGEVVMRALQEDLGAEGDVTSRATVPETATCTAALIAREDGVVAGLPILEVVFGLLDQNVVVTLDAADGDRVRAGQMLGSVDGWARSVLSGERVALNFVTHLSGIATLTRAYVDAVEGTGAQVLCTRKTLPGLRALERYAVACGGGRLHRAGLFDGVLIKDNHVIVSGGVAEAIRRARATAPHTLKVEVEVDGLDMLREALEAGADLVLLDNFEPSEVAEAVALAGDRAVLEVSGGVSLDTIADYAKAGPVLISVGRLTHSAPALDIALDVRA
jgi:nicotinate-nucleotide pyrophosphorylase (carboxylating)